ncbi:MAG: alpha/beta hydrolase, partial [Bacillota bacterium]
MNESSSKFVDKLAMEKLISEKLTEVSHSPVNSPFENIDISLDRLEEFSLDISRVKSIKNNNGNECFLLPSFFAAGQYESNNDVYLHYFPAGNPEGNIILVHGLYDDNVNNYMFLIQLLNKLNMNVFFMNLPFHYDRKPTNSLFGGEYFFSADFYRSRYAFKQAIFDIELTGQFIEIFNILPTILMGFSMGGCLVSRYYLHKKNMVDIFLINPVTNLMNLPWDNPLILSIGKDIEDSGFDSNVFKNIFSGLDPCEKPQHFGENTAMVYAEYDQIIEERKYEKFIRLTGIKNVRKYQAGHL